jgi:hypothetical protein
MDRCTFLDDWRRPSSESDLAFEDVRDFCVCHPRLVDRTLQLFKKGFTERRRKPRLKTVLYKARKAGAASVTTPEGYTYTLGHATEHQIDTELTTADDELARWRRKHAR